MEPYGPYITGTIWDTCVLCGPICVTHVPYGPYITGTIWDTCVLCGPYLCYTCAIWALYYRDHMGHLCPMWALFVLHMLPYGPFMSPIGPQYRNMGSTWPCWQRLYSIDINMRIV